MKTERLSLISEPFLTCDIHVDASGILHVLRKDGGIHLLVTNDTQPKGVIPRVYLPDEDVTHDIVRSGHDPRETFTVVEE